MKCAHDIESLGLVLRGKERERGQRTLREGERDFLAVCARRLSRLCRERVGQRVVNVRVLSAVLRTCSLDGKERDCRLEMVVELKRGGCQPETWRMKSENVRGTRWTPCCHRLP